MNTLERRYTDEEKRRTLEQVLSSDTFARADQLKRFLRYICEMEAAGRAGEISEYAIGTDALGRPSNYSTGDDSAVRGRARALRQKLIEFYNLEGADSPLRIELRKGSYVPHYVNGHADAALQAPNARASRSPGLVSAPRAFGAGLVVSALVAVAVFLLLRPAKPLLPSPDPILKEFWGPMLQPGMDVLVCVGSTPAMLLASYKDGILPAEPRIIPAPADVVQWYASLHMLDGGGSLYSQTSLNTTLFGDALAAIVATNTLTKAGKSFQVLPEHSTRALTLRGRNLLLIGSPNYSPYAAQILRKARFLIRFDPTIREEIISEVGSDKSPLIFVPKRDEFGQLVRAYGLLTVLPSQANGDGSSRTAIFSGITSAGTQAAMEFFASPASLKDLKSRFRTAGLQNVPLAYQVVVRCGLDRNLALNWTYETHRVLDKPPIVD